MIFVINKETKEIIKRVHPLSDSNKDTINNLDTKLYAYYESDEAFKKPVISDDGAVMDEIESRPSEYHIWNEEKFEWIIPDEIIIPIKEKLKGEITAYRDSLREVSTVEYDGHNQRYRKDDLSDIDYYQNRLEKAQIKAQALEDKLAIEEEREAEEIRLTIEWYFYDGSTAKLGIDDFDNIVALTDFPILELYRKEKALKNKVENIETLEELENFDIESEWKQA